MYLFVVCTCVCVCFRVNVCFGLCCVKWAVTVDTTNNYLVMGYWLHDCVTYITITVMCSGQNDIIIIT